MTTRRKLDPGFSNQYIIPLDTDFTLGFAYNDQTNSLSSIHSQNGYWVFNLPSDGTSGGGSGGTTDDDTDSEDESGDEYEDGDSDGSNDDGESGSEDDGEEESGDDDLYIKSKINKLTKKHFKLTACPTPLPLDPIVGPTNKVVTPAST